MTILGIDLGTTNSACAVWRNGSAVLIPNRLDTFLTPSVVGVDDGGELLVGEIAKHRLISHPDKTAAVFKRYMGTNREVKLGAKPYSAPELSSLVLKSLKEDAETYLQQPINEAIISVPAYFNDTQRKATKLAAELVGLRVERLINEPTAAAMVYGLHEQSEGAQFLIVDLGGGTFDVSIVEYFDGVIEVHASAGDNHLGGEDFLNLIAEAYFKTFNIDKEKLKPSQLQNVFDKLEQAKIALTTQHEYEVSPIIPKQETSWQFTREMLNEFVKPLLNRIQMPVERSLRDADISPSEIDEIVLVGGATRMQIFRSLIAKMFRRLPIAKLDPDLVVAMGAAVQAGLRENQADLGDVVLTDVCPYTLGTGVVNEADKNDRQGLLYLPVIERNTVVPVSKETSIMTAVNNQTELKVQIYQGEHRLVKHNIYLGELTVKVPKGPAGKETIDLRYSYDMNGLLDVDVTICSTGEKYNKTILNTPDELSQTEIEASKVKLAKLKFHPREHEQNRKLVAKLEAMFEASLGEKREYISGLLTQFELVLAKQNLNEIEKAHGELQKTIQNMEEEDIFS